MRKRQADQADRGNCAAAEIILADPAKHAGLAQMWAELWLDRHQARRNGENQENHPRTDKHRQKQLFETNEAFEKENRA
jgi:hypothetical protein